MKTVCLLFFLIFSFALLARVGPVDHNQKAAACTNNPESSASKPVERDVNPSKLLANLLEGVEEEKSRKRRPKSGSSGSVQ